MITRHFLDVGLQRVHFRMCGNGPPLLMAHPLPRSSAMLEPLMHVWGRHFTCIAPDMPGFGQSDALHDGRHVDAFAAALIAFLDALEVRRCGAYGVRSGGVLLAAAMRRDPERFSALAIGGYAVWTPDERAGFERHVLQPLRPTAYGEHLVSLWNRVLEQGWFSPWGDASGGLWRPDPHDDAVRVHAAVMDLLDAGDGYREGYAAILNAPPSLPVAGEAAPPVLITAADDDPLQGHIGRLGPLPANASARAVATQAGHERQSLAFLLEHPAPAIGAVPAIEDEGFARIRSDGFDGLIHWTGLHTASRMQLHAPGGEARPGPALAIDLPGHGLSDDWAGGSAARLDAWRSFVNACRTHFGIRQVEGTGWSAALGNREAPRPAPEMADRLIPDLTPDRFGGHLVRAWGVARARRLFDPWYCADAANALPIDQAAMTPEAIARDTHALLRARAGRALMKALSEGDA